MTETLFSYDALVKRWGMSKSWIYARVREGKLRPWAESTYRMTRFTLEEVRHFEVGRSLPKGSDDFTAASEVVEFTVMGSDGKP